MVQMKNLGYTTLMCGDGTNDVGALKHADVGVAILSAAPEKLPDPKEIKENKEKKLKEMVNIKNKGNHVRTTQEQKEKLQASLDKMMREMEQEQGQLVKLGDASIASPFTSKLSSIMCSKCFVCCQATCSKHKCCQCTNKVSDSGRHKVSCSVLATMTLPSNLMTSVFW